jgi:hypothetical protein
VNWPYSFSLALILGLFFRLCYCRIGLGKNHYPRLRPQNQQFC